MGLPYGDRRDLTWREIEAVLLMALKTLTAHETSPSRATNLRMTKTVFFPVFSELA
jgi:hypothetical protein